MLSSNTSTTATATATASSSSQARIDANRANAKLSTGPRTEAGKLASSRNAIRTGLTSAQLFARPGEELQALQDLTLRLHNELAPSGPMEEHYADAILHAMWNLRRCANLEAELQMEANRQGLPDPILDPAAAPNLDRIHRYRRMHEASLRKATAELRRLQTERYFRAETGSDLDASAAEAGGLSVLASTLEAAPEVRAGAGVEKREKYQRSVAILEQFLTPPRQSSYAAAPAPRSCSAQG